MCSGGRNRKIYLSEQLSPSTNPPCAVVILCVLPPWLHDGCGGIATRRLTTCSAPFTAHPIPLGVIQHCCAAAVGTSNGNAEKLICTNEVVLRHYRMIRKKALIVNVVLLINAVIECIALAWSESYSLLGVLVRYTTLAELLLQACAASRSGVLIHGITSSHYVNATLTKIFEYWPISIELFQ